MAGASRVREIRSILVSGVDRNRANTWRKEGVFQECAQQIHGERFTAGVELFPRGDGDLLISPAGAYLELEIVDERQEVCGIPAGVGEEGEEGDGGRWRGRGGAGDATDETEQFPQMREKNRGEGEGGLEGGDVWVGRRVRRDVFGQVR